MKILSIFILLIPSFAVATPQSHLQHIERYSKSYKTTRQSPWGPVFIKNNYSGEPALAPNQLDIVLICSSKRKTAKPLLVNYPHCGLEDVSFNKDKKQVLLHLLDVDNKTGLCLKRRIKSLPVPCP